VLCQRIELQNWRGQSQGLVLIGFIFKFCYSNVSRESAEVLNVGSANWYPRVYHTACARILEADNYPASVGRFGSVALLIVRQGCEQYVKS
jgi:hypothetical protein